MTAKAGSNWCCPRMVHRPEVSGGTHESARRATSRHVNGAAAMSGNERSQARRQETLGEGDVRGGSGEHGVEGPIGGVPVGAKKHSYGEQNVGPSGVQVESES